MEGMPRTTRQQLDAAVGALKGQKSPVDQANFDIPVSVTQLFPGNYHAFAIDLGGNLSAESATTVVVRQASHLNSVLSFSFNGFTPQPVGQIVGTDISVGVLIGTDLTSLVANFSLSPLAKAYVGLVRQYSGVTPNNFSKPVVYTVEAEDGYVLEYTVTVSFYSSIDQQPEYLRIKTYPNPFSDHLIISLNQAADRVEIVSMTGQTMVSLIDPERDVAILKTDTWMKGIYLVRYFQDGRYAGTVKVVKY
jgi:hypothetical protein